MNFTEYNFDLSAQKLRGGGDGGHKGLSNSMKGFNLRTAGAILDTTDDNEEDDDSVGVPVFTYKLS